MSENPTKVTLGDREYQLAPQRIGRIGRKLSQVMDLFAGVGSGQVPTDVAPLYEALKVFIPDIDPIWKLAGYPSEEAYGALAAHEKKVEQARKRFAASHGPKAEGAEKSEAEWADLPDEVRAEFTPPAFEDPYDEAADRSPTPPEIMNAIETIFALHGGQRLVKLLRNFVTPEMIRGQILRMQVEAASARSRSLRLESGGSDPTPSTTPNPTPGEAGSLVSLQPGS
jgi:hypothetical protein